MLVNPQDHGAVRPKLHNSRVLTPIQDRLAVGGVNYAPIADKFAGALAAKALKTLQRQFEFFGNPGQPLVAFQRHVGQLIGQIVKAGLAALFPKIRQNLFAGILERSHFASANACQADDVISVLSLHRLGVLPDFLQGKQRFLKFGHEHAGPVPAQVAPQGSGTGVLGDFFGQCGKVLAGHKSCNHLIGPGQNLFVTFGIGRQQNMAGLPLERTDELVTILFVPLQGILLGDLIKPGQTPGIELDIFEVDGLAGPEARSVAFVVGRELFVANNALVTKRVRRNQEPAHCAALLNQFYVEAKIHRGEKRALLDSPVELLQRHQAALLVLEVGRSLTHAGKSAAVQVVGKLTAVQESGNVLNYARKSLITDGESALLGVRANHVGIDQVVEYQGAKLFFKLLRQGIAELLTQAKFFVLKRTDEFSLPDIQSVYVGRRVGAHAHVAAHGAESQHQGQRYYTEDQEGHPTA